MNYYRLAFFHPALLTKEEGIDIILGRRGCQAFGFAAVDHDKAGSNPDFPSGTFLKVLQRLVRHQEHGVTESLGAGLEAIGGGNLSSEWLVVNRSANKQNRLSDPQWFAAAWMARRYH